MLFVPAMVVTAVEFGDLTVPPLREKPSSKVSTTTIASVPDQLVTIPSTTEGATFVASMKSDLTKLRTVLLSLSSNATDVAVGDVFLSSFLFPLLSGILAGRCFSCD